MFLCISLKADWVADHYLRKNNVHLPVLQKVVEHLGIDQPSNESNSSPPYLMYDPRFFEALHQANIIPFAEKRELYHIDKDPDSASCCSCRSSVFFHLQGIS